MVLLAGAEPVILGTGIDDDFKVTPARLAAALSDKTRLLILNSPGNPTGASYTRAEIQALGDVLEPYPQVVVVADDIYEHIYWADEPFVSFAAACPALYERTVTTNGVSKAYAMTGWRIGYAAGPEALINAMKTVQSQSTSNACSVSQAAAQAALEGDQAAVADMCAAYRKRHDYIVSELNRIEGVACRPGEGTFYAFPRVHGVLERLGLADDVALAELLLNEADVACVPGSAFGAPGYLRISYACSLETLEEAADRLNRVLSA
jgi:aspartate aminotransferase